ncbi:GNAT family N-acetyltransferase [Chitinophaga qingshengii]|uniref:GNAT family N-acetyltransferase n=1 Tax=Chitinophaga qingshengii TaxID=1569794 RepID=A0ABR7TSB9_9BACT|nr:GNAT family N-acetyltransferase [Chitinophaga qingshengii]MBC9932898.1 GNAT family N-acetyltransferase [Chitinophaga qingshengii]
MEIINSHITDIDDIFYLYDEGTKYQLQQGVQRYWKGFERSVVEQEIAEQRQWKLVADGKIVCVFVTTFSDPLIWGSKDQDPSLYLHRIATHPQYRGRGFVKHIVDWAIRYGQAHQRQYLRLDTGAGNEKLNNYYVSCGFTYLGVVDIPDPVGLPAHYREGGFAIFELSL